MAASKRRSTKSNSPTRYSKMTTQQVLGRGPIHPFPARMAAGIVLAALEDAARTMAIKPRSRIPRTKKGKKNPAIDGYTNRDRAAMAGQLVTEFVMQNRCEKEQTETIVGDMLADIFHWCRLNRVSIEGVIARGRRHHDEEAKFGWDEQTF